MIPDDQLKFYGLIIQENPNFNEEDRIYAQEQQSEILSMLKRTGASIEATSLPYLLSKSLQEEAMRLFF